MEKQDAFLAYHTWNTHAVLSPFEMQPKRVRGIKALPLVMYVLILKYSYSIAMSLGQNMSKMMPCSKDNDVPTPYSIDQMIGYSICACH